MTISSSMNAGVAGLSANANKLATISDNIANSGTYGYKRAQTEFHSMVINTGTGSYAAGGVRVTSVRLVDQSGSYVTTSNPTDLAIRGGGFLPVTSVSSLALQSTDYPMMMTTTGSFRMNADGYLVTSTGLVLMGWPANADGSIETSARDTSADLQPIQIQSNQFAAEPTTAISLGVNLPASETEVGSSGLPLELSVEYFDNLGTSQNISVTYEPTVPVPPATGLSNEWTMTLRDSAQGGAVIGEYTVQFDDGRTDGGTIISVTPVSGGAYDPATGSFTVTVAGGPIEITVGRPGDPNGMTQLSDSFAPTSITKDGFPVGNLTGVEIDNNGYVRASYDTGISRVLYQVPLVDVSNPNGLTALDNQTYAVSNSSGSFFLWDAGDGPTGDVLSYALEMSTTDVAGELTSLIETQHAYSSNAKVIQTVDEMLQETTNIKR